MAVIINGNLILSLLTVFTLTIIKKIKIFTLFFFILPVII